jgi:ubiquinol-cytochrome c reductase cytochrome c subunit
VSLRRAIEAALLAVPVAVAAALVPVFLTGTAHADTSSRRAAADPTTDPKTIFQRDCAVCHGNDARGTNVAPDLRGFGRASIDYELSTGRMPLPAPTSKTDRRTPKYPRAVQRALVDYVYDLAGGGGPDIPPVDTSNADIGQGGELFRLNCAACHEWSGRGGALLYRAAPSIHQATELQIAEAVRAGPGTMPAFGTAAISHEQLNDVVAYVRYLRHPVDRGGEPLWFLGPLIEGAVAWVIAMGLLLVVVRWIGTKT